MRSPCVQNDLLVQDIMLHEEQYNETAHRQQRHRQAHLDDIQLHGVSYVRVPPPSLRPVQRDIL